MPRTVKNAITRLQANRAITTRRLFSIRRGVICRVRGIVGAARASATLIEINIVTLMLQNPTGVERIEASSDCESRRSICRASRAEDNHFAQEGIAKACDILHRPILQPQGSSSRVRQFREEISSVLAILL